MLCEKYRASCFLDVKGQELAIERLKNFVKKFPQDKKSVILHGPTGTGKTSLAYALANELKAEILELNASDLRNEEQIRNIIKPASEQQSLSNKGKIILVDEVDGITVDRGGLPELISLIESTSFPIIITANNIWQQKFNILRQKSELVQLKNLDYRTILNLLKEIAKKESIIVNDEILTSIAIKARGDARAALNDLQTVSLVNKPEDFGERDKEEDIFNILRQVFKNLTTPSTLRLYDNTEMSLDDIFLWLEENIPAEYKGIELWKAYEALSIADVFRGRIHRQQYWRFLVYQNILLSAGISSVKKTAKMNFTVYKKPERILKIWLNNQRTIKKKSIAGKYAKYCHISTKRAMKDFPIIITILKKLEVQKQLKLSDEELEYLNELKIVNIN